MLQSIEMVDNVKGAIYIYIYIARNPSKTNPPLAYLNFMLIFMLVSHVTVTCLLGVISTKCPFPQVWIYKL